TKPVGIKNLGSTCFVTCVLQCMLSVAEFTCLASQMKRGLRHYQQQHHNHHHHASRRQAVPNRAQQHQIEDKVDNDEDVNSANKASSTSSSSSAAASNAPSCEHTALYEPQNGYGEVAAAMVDLFNKCQVNVEDLTTDTKPAVNPVRLLSALKRKYPKNPLFMDLAEEQDCHEFLSVLLDALHGCTMGTLY
ncbi:hypothetical protein FOZ63_018661, partial [Perkinsus olseni]